MREKASSRKHTARTGQLALLDAPAATDARYDSLHAGGFREAPKALVARIAAAGPTTFATVWPEILEANHITKAELARIAWELARHGELEVTNARPLERTMKDDHVLRPKG